MDPNLNIDEILKDIYYNLNNPASFSSVKNLYEAARKKMLQSVYLMWKNGFQVNSLILFINK